MELVQGKEWWLYTYCIMLAEKSLLGELTHGGLQIFQLRLHEWADDVELKRVAAGWGGAVRVAWRGGGGGGGGWEGGGGGRVGARLGS